MADQLFDDNQGNPQATPEQQVQPQSSGDVFADQLAAIKNEQGEQKYDTLEKALEALQHSQNYIPSLKSEMAAKDAELIQLKAKLEAMKSVEELVTPSTPNDQEANQPKGLSEEDISKLLESKLQENQAAQVASNNLGEVVNTLTQRYGESTQSKIQEKAAEFGYKPSELKKLAEQNPKLVLSLFGEKQGTPAPNSGGQYVPPTPPQESVGETKGLLIGAKTSDQVEHLKKIRAEVYAKYNVQE